MIWKLEVTIKSEGDPLSWGEKFWEDAINKGVVGPDDPYYDRVLSVECIELNGIAVGDKKNT